MTHGAESVTCVLRVPYVGAYDWPSLRLWLAQRAIDGVESVRDDGYARSALVHGTPCLIDVSVVVADAAVHARVASRTPIDPDAVRGSVTRVFDLDRDLARTTAVLGRDPWLARLIARHAGLRVPGGWDPFELAIRAVLGQQVTVVAARALAAQLVACCGEPLPSKLATPAVWRTFPTAAAVAAADLTSLRMPASRRATLKALAEAAHHEPDLFDAAQDLDAAIARLRRIKGIGEWTAHYVALRALRAPDAFPVGDVGLLRAAAQETGTRPSSAALDARAEQWRPHRAYAAQLLWAADGAA